MSLLRPIRDTSETAIGLTRERLETMGWRRLLVAWVLQALVLLVVGRVVPGITVENLPVALVGALVIGLLNALVRPILVLMTLPLTVLTVGLLSLAINAIVLAIAATLVPGLTIDSGMAAIAAAILITVLGTIVSTIMASDQDASFYAELTRRLAALDRPPVPGARGLVIIQIDGLAAPILRNAIRVGLTPTMAKWVRSGAYRLIEWECVPPSQTSASQAGILHGSNDDIPAFRWYEKERGRMMVSNKPADAAEIERRLSDGKGLLASGGMSAGNLFSGDAGRTLFTMSKIQQPSTAADVDAFSLYFVDPAAFVRTIVLTIGEVAKEWSEARRQQAHDIQPRVHRGRNFAVLRSVSNVLLRDLNVTFVMNAMGRGAPIMYVDFVDYDELAHHAGPERLESLRSLSGVDRVLGSIARAAKHAPREYSIVVLSDHGQSQGATFLQRFGVTLDRLVRDLMGGASSLAATSDGEGWGPVNALLSEVSKRGGVAGRATVTVLGDHRSEGAVELGASEPTTVNVAEGTAKPEVVVGASGNLANIYFTVDQRRLSLEDIESRYPGVIEGLAAHPGIGFVMVRSEARGPLAIGRAGIHHLDDGRVEGSDPLAPFGPLAAEHLRRLDSFPHVGDILVNSTYDAELEEVAAFEELVGSHGGFGGPQVRPFILAPTDLLYEGQPVVGAPAVHRLLVTWADGLGVGPSSGATDVPPASSADAREPRGIKVTAGLTAFTSLLWVLAGFAFLVGASELALPQLTVPAVILFVLGGVGMLVARGLWRRQRWARMAALGYYAIGILQALAAIGDQGLGGVLSVGVVPVLMAFLVFFYLTRPHVAAAFNRERVTIKEGSDS